MDTENLYLFELKPALAGESNYSLVFDKVAIPAKDWIMNWEYLDSFLDVVLFVFS